MTPMAPMAPGHHMPPMAPMAPMAPGHHMPMAPGHHMPMPPGHHMDMGHMMQMTFTSGIHVKVLFDFWDAKSPGVYAASIIIVSFFCLMYVFLHYLTQKLQRDRMRKFSAREDISWLLTIIQLVAYCGQVTLSYLIMLVAMTYNAGLFITVVLSLTLGYWIFYLRRTKMTDEEAEAEEALLIGKSYSSNSAKHGLEPASGCH